MDCSWSYLLSKFSKKKDRYTVGAILILIVIQLWLILKCNDAIMVKHHGFTCTCLFQTVHGRIGDLCRKESKK